MKYVLCLILLIQSGCAEMGFRSPMGECKTLCQARKVKFFRDDTQNCSCNTEFEEQKDLQEGNEE